MARGMKLEYDVDHLNRMVWIVDFLSDEWDTESSIGMIPYRYREDAMAAGRKWLHGTVNSFDELQALDDQLTNHTLVL
jgi:hypothetical protein